MTSRPAKSPALPSAEHLHAWANSQGLSEALRERVSTLQDPGRLSPPLLQRLLRPLSAYAEAPLGFLLEQRGVWAQFHAALTEQESDLFVHQLREHFQWLGNRALTLRDGQEEPPLTLPLRHGQLQTWLRRNGLEDLVERKVDRFPDLAPLLKAAPSVFSHSYFSLGLLLTSRTADEASQQLKEAAVRLLEDEARDLRAGVAAEPQRLASFAIGPTHPSLVPLFTRLRALRDGLRRMDRPTSAKTLDGMVLRVAEEPWALEVCDPRLTRAGERDWVELGLDERRPRYGCPCSTWRYAPDFDGCRHLLGAVDAALRFLVTPSSALDLLVQRLSLPQWDHVLRKLQGALGKTAEASKSVADAPASQLVWSVRKGWEGLQLTPILKKPLKKGGWSKGSPLRPRELASRADPGIGAADRRAAAALARFEHRGGVELALEALAGSKRLFFEGDPDRPVELLQGELALEVRTREDGSLGVVPSVSGWELPLDAFEDLERSQVTLVHADEEAGRVALVHLRDDAMAGLVLLAREGTEFPQEAGPALMEVFSATPFESNLPPALLGEEVDAPPRLALFITPQGELAFLLEARVRCLEQPLPLPVAQGPTRVRGTQQGRAVFAQRDFEEEATQAAALWARLGLEEGGDSKRVEGQEALEVLRTLEALEQEGLEVAWPPARPRFKRPVVAGDLRLSVSAGRDWFGLSGQAELDGEQLELAVLLAAARNRQRYVQLKSGGWTELTQQLQAQLAPVAEVSEEGADGTRLSRVAGVLLQPLEAQVAELRACESFQSLSSRLREAGEYHPVLPGGLKATLRPYQQEGYQWLARLARWSPGAVLADDMGLGKTLQALALLEERKALGPALVVAPTSLGFNWEQEAARFTPGLNVISYRHGGRDEVFAKLGPGDLLVVSYGLLTQAAERFAQQRFATVVIDEAHAVKNGATLRSRVVRDLQADFRLALTGTPLENHLGELWSLFRTVIPGLLGSEEQFRKRFWLPIEKHKDVQKRRSLSRLIGPFLLRRKKSQVALDLPDRTEILRPVELSEPERKLYEEARLAAVAELAGVDGGPPEQRRFKVLAAITRLRLLACHPGLHDKQWTGPASKLETLLELVEELRAGGHRILVFSQFTQHLEKVKVALEERGVGLQYLDGSTPELERRRRVQAFQAGEGELFLISLKAGGMGLNLTAANYVIHLDPWWNPAVEDQATDRAHRIGQTRAVTVYRLVAKGTIEESILALHGEKRELIAGVLEGTGVAARLGTEELTKLLEEAA